ncbi:MAG: PsbP-related protein [Acidimicrobiales bacterium]
MDEQPPSRPGRPRPQPPRRRPAGRSRSAASTGARPPGRRTRPPAPPARRPPVDDADDSSAAPQPNRSQTKLVVLLSVLTVVVLGVGALAFTANNRSSDDLPPPAPDNTPVPMTTFKDAQTGFTVEYPRAWRRVEVPVADYRLAVDAGNNVAFTIRVVPIQTPATAQNLQNFKAVTDGLVASNSTVSVLKEQAISLNGMLGYYYFYTFTDGGVQAVHAHYFLFSGNKMNVIVFQTLPDDFQGMAATFDKIAESFRSDPNVPSTATAATAPSSTTSTTAG